MNVIGYGGILMFWLSLLLILFFIPIPLKITIQYTDKKFHFFIYNKDILKKSKKHNNSKSNINSKVRRKSNFSIKDLGDFADILDSSLFKFNIKFSFNLNLGLENASTLAILFGILNSFNIFVYKILSLGFNIKKFQFNIVPKFNKKLIYLESESIIYITIAKLIYISLRFLKFFYLKINLKEV